MRAHGARPVLLFDLGRVLIDIDFDRCFEAWAAANPEPVHADTLRARFSTDESFEAHERGELGCEEFLTRLGERLGLALDVEALREGWNAIFGPDVPGMRPALARAASRADVYVLSNTNPTHAQCFSQRHAQLLEPVLELFTSHELGMRKPDPGIYARVVAAIGVDPARVLFLDDSVANLEGAARAGLRTQHVRDFREVPAMLDAMLGAR